MKLTDARRRGLEVLMEGARLARPVRVSNLTTAGDASRLFVYWQTADWLVAQHLADRDGEVLTLRSKGRQVAREADLS